MLITKFIQRNEHELSLRIERASSSERRRFADARGLITDKYVKNGTSGTSSYWLDLLIEGLQHASQLTKFALDELFAIGKAERLKVHDDDVSALIDFAAKQFNKPAQGIAEELSRMANERGMGRAWHAGTMKPRIDEARRLASDVEVPIRVAQLRRELSAERRKWRIDARDKVIILIVGVALGFFADAIRKWLFPGQSH